MAKDTNYGANLGSENKPARSADGVTRLQEILAQFWDDARNNRDLGDRFERMMHRFFRVSLSRGCNVGIDSF
jgi:hypothetical protein